jgi:hypothetical protein
MLVGLDEWAGLPGGGMVGEWWVWWVIGADE